MDEAGEAMLAYREAEVCKAASCWQGITEGFLPYM